MDRDEISKKYYEVLSERLKLEQNVKDFEEAWKNKKNFVPSKMAQEVIETGYERLDNLKNKKKVYMSN